MSGRNAYTRRTAIASGAAVVISAVAGCIGGSGSDRQGLETTFDEGKEGWTAVDLVASDADSNPDWSEVIGTLDLNHRGEGGVDDSGHVRRVDDTGNAFFFDASDAYTGDKSEYVGGTLEFSLESTHNGYRQDAAVILEGSDGVIATQFAKPGSDWTQYRIELDASARPYRESNLGGPEVAQERVEAVLSGLQALRIGGEHGGAVREEVALDEVRLRHP